MKKKEDYSFTKKFKDSDIAEKQKNLSEQLMQKYNLERQIISSKNQIKSIEQNITSIGKELKDGGERMTYEECDVKIYRKTNKKEYFYENELVGEKEAEEEDFQLEIDED